MKHGKTFEAIKKLQDVEIELHRLKNALEIANKALDAQRTWVGLTDEDRQAVFESMPDMLDGFLKTWGWLHFSKAIEAKLKQKNGYEEKNT